jgi:hypothetical protein
MKLLDSRNSTRIAALTICLLGLVIASRASAAVTYEAKLLYPIGGSRGFAASGASQVGLGAGPATGGQVHALLWSGSAASAVDLHPAGFNWTEAHGVSGTSQAGFGFLAPPLTGAPAHALLWNGSAASVVDLHPPGLIESYAWGVSGATQVGQGKTSEFIDHALLWSGSAASVVDLHPAGYSHSWATGVSGTSQVGAGGLAPSGVEMHALLWRGSAASVVDLHPAGFAKSYAYGVSGASQVGFSESPDFHALLWSGSAASVVDLHPPTGFDHSGAFGVSSAGQVGGGRGTATGGAQHALVWNGSAASAIDLHPYLTGLGPNFTSSNASGIADDGTIIGTAEADSGSYAVLWTPIPEPSAGVLFACGMVAAAVSRHRSRVCGIS